MAELLEIKPLTYERLERGVTILSVDRLIRIAEILKVKVKDLI